MREPHGRPQPRLFDRRTHKEGRRFGTGQSGQCLHTYVSQKICRQRSVSDPARRGGRRHPPYPSDPDCSPPAIAFQTDEKTAGGSEPTPDPAHDVSPSRPPTRPPHSAAFPIELAHQFRPRNPRPYRNRGTNRTTPRRTSEITQDTQGAPSGAGPSRESFRARANARQHALQHRSACVLFGFLTAFSGSGAGLVGVRD